MISNHLPTSNSLEAMVSPTLCLILFWLWGFQPAISVDNSIFRNSINMLNKNVLRCIKCVLTAMFSLLLLTLQIIRQPYALDKLKVRHKENTLYLLYLNEWKHAVNAFTLTCTEAPVSNVLQLEILVQLLRPPFVWTYYIIICLCIVFFPCNGLAMGQLNRNGLTEWHKPY